MRLRPNYTHSQIPWFCPGSELFCVWTCFVNLSCFYKLFILQQSFLISIMLHKKNYIITDITSLHVPGSFFHQVPWILKVPKHPHVGSAPWSRSIPTSNGFFPEPHPTTKFGVNPLPSSVGGYKHLSERCHGPKKPTEMGNWKQQLITLLWVRITI